MKEYIAMWKNFGNFNDQTSRKGYWMATLINMIVVWVISFLASQVEFFGIIAGLYSLAILIPTISISVRRLHDIGKKWPWIFIGLVPIAGPIIYLVFMCTATKANGVQV